MLLHKLAPTLSLPLLLVLTQLLGIAWVGAWYAYMRKREPALAMHGDQAGQPVEAVRSNILHGSIARVTTILAVAVTAVYLLTWLYEWAAGVPSEDFMRTFFVGRSGFEMALLLVAVFIMAPVGEELAFRYFLLEAMPYRRGRWHAFVSVVVVTIAFALVHMQYQHVSTFVALVLIGGIFAYARLWTGRLYPSMLLHFLTAVLGLVIQYVQGFD